jgi:hypothetical protein
MVPVTVDLASLVSYEAVAQRFGRSASVGAAGSDAGAVRADVGGVTAVGAVSGPLGGDLVAVKLGQVVGCHQ